MQIKKHAAIWSYMKGAFMSVISFDLVWKNNYCDAFHIAILVRVYYIDIFPGLSSMWVHTNSKINAIELCWSMSQIVLLLIKTQSHEFKSVTNSSQRITVSSFKIDYLFSVLPISAVPQCLNSPVDRIVSVFRKLNCPAYISALVLCASLTKLYLPPCDEPHS